MPLREHALDFVRQNSPDPSADLLPGLCLLTERWLAQASLLSTAKGHVCLLCAVFVAACTKSDVMCLILYARTRQIPVQICFQASVCSQSAGWHRQALRLA